MTETTLVTGATGFVGRWVVRELLDAGHRVVVLSRSGRAPGLILDVIVEPGDLDNFDLLSRLVQRHAIRRIVHSAGVVGGSTANADPVAAVRTNVLGTEHLLEAARQAGAERFVNVSSGSAYGVRAYSSDPLTEDDPPRHPMPNLYAATKLMGEQLCATYSKAFGLATVSVRLSRVYGPGREMSVKLPLDDLLLDAQAGGPLLVTPGMELPTDYTYVKDVAAGIRAVLEAPMLRHSLYNLAGGAPSHGRAVADAIAQVVPGVHVRAGTAAAGESAYPYPRPSLSIERIREDIGFVPRFDLRSGVTDYLAELHRAAVAVA